MFSTKKMILLSAVIAAVSIPLVRATGVFIPSTGDKGQGQGQGGGNNKNNKTCQYDNLCAKCNERSGRCQYCISGYMLTLKPFSQYQCTPVDANSKCDKFCTSTCSRNGDGNCDSQCQPGYILSSKNCRSCDANCDLSTGCSVSGPGLCDTQCNDGFILVNKTCKACANHCTSGCSVQGPYKCDSTCEFGWGLDNVTHTCRACDSHCDPTSGCTINGPLSCDVNCTSGYVLRTVLAGKPPICRRCDEHCTSGCKIQGPNRCDSKCKPGYRLNTVSHMCQECAPNCDPAYGCDINGAFRCDKCKPNYTLQNKVCYPCDQHCDPSAGCDKTGIGNCDGPCMNTYHLDGKHCI